jgi:aldehyde dehydrogenase (NAD+)
MEYKTNINSRKEKLKQLLNVVIQHENEIVSALYNDFKKPEFEAVVTETSYVISELKHTINNIDKLSLIHI